RSAPPRHPPSFPTRRSSDLVAILQYGNADAYATFEQTDRAFELQLKPGGPFLDGGGRRIEEHAEGKLPESLHARVAGRAAQMGRSEEHTSELQSRENLVCRL